MAEHLFRVRRTIWEMLHDRGFAVSHANLNMDLQRFKDEFGEQPKREDMTILALHPETHEKLFVFFPDEPKVGVKPIKKYVERMTNENIHHAIIVVQESITPIEALGDFHLEQFLDSELLVNVTRHVLVPRHFPMTDEQKRALLEKYKVKETQLPRIQVGDPIAHYFGLRRGQVVKIVRPSETAGRYVTYRFCV